MRSHAITVIGSLNCDLITVTDRVPGPGETLTASSFRTAPGGKGSNQALAAQRASHTRPTLSSSDPPGDAYRDEDFKVSMIGAVGADQFKDLAIEYLKTDGVDVSNVRVVKGETTGVANVLVESRTGENRILLKPGANHSLRPDGFLTSASILGGNQGAVHAKPDILILQLEIPLETVNQIIGTASKEGVDVLLNPAPAVELPSSIYLGVTHLILNETEASFLSGTSIAELEDVTGWRTVTEYFLELGVKNVVLTLGAKGAFFSNARGTGSYIPAEKGIHVVDTTGAGDTFVGAYAVQAVRGKSNGTWDLREAVKWCCKAAARAVEREGAQDSIPWADEIERD